MNFSEIEKAIDLIDDLPNLVMYHTYKITDDSGETGKFFANLQRLYHIEANWLRSKILYDIKALALVNYGQAKYCEPIAQKSRNLLDLINQIYTYHSFENVQVLKETFSPIFWWLLCKAEYFYQQLENGGYFGEPKILGKSNQYKLTQEIERYWSDENNHDFAATVTGLSFVANDPSIRTYLQMVEETAAQIAKFEPKFKPYWWDYLEANTKLTRQIRDCKELHNVYLVDGEVQILSRGKGKRKRKGFAKQC